jgi:hypothetical protein
MNWVVAVGAILFAVFALSMMAPTIIHDPLSMLAVFMVGVFVGMMLENAMSSDRPEDER